METKIKIMPILSLYHHFMIPFLLLTFRNSLHLYVCIPFQTEDFNGYFSGRKRLLPKHTDLSFYNWDTNFAVSNSTPNYQVFCCYYCCFVVVHHNSFVNLKLLNCFVVLFAQIKIKKSEYQTKLDNFICQLLMFGSFFSCWF